MSVPADGEEGQGSELIRETKPNGSGKDELRRRIRKRRASITQGVDDIKDKMTG